MKFYTWVDLYNGYTKQLLILNLDDQPLFLLELCIHLIKTSHSIQHMMRASINTHETLTGGVAFSVLTIGFSEDKQEGSWKSGTFILGWTFTTGILNNFKFLT